MAYDKEAHMRLKASFDTPLTKFEQAGVAHADPAGYMKRMALEQANEMAAEFISSGATVWLSVWGEEEYAKVLEDLGNCDFGALRKSPSETTSDSLFGYGVKLPQKSAAKPAISGLLTTATENHRLGRFNP